MASPARRTGRPRTSLELDQLPPESRNVHDRDVLDLAQAQQIVVGRHDVVRSAADCTLQELVIVWVPAASDGWRRVDEESLALEENRQSPRLEEAQAELLKDVGPAQDIFDLLEDWVGEEEGETAGPPGVVDLGGEAIRPGDGASQEDLGVKNDAKLWQIAGPRRSLRQPRGPSDHVDGSVPAPRWRPAPGRRAPGEPHRCPPSPLPS